MKRRTMATGTTLAVLAATAATAASCGGSPEGALAGKSATDIVSLSVTALHHQRSFHFVSKIVDGSQTQLQVGDIGKAAAAETITTGKKVVADAVLDHGTVYIRANTQLLENALSLPDTTATAETGDWVSVSKGDAVYSSVSSSLTATSAIELFVPEEPHLKVDGATTFEGQSVVAVSGSSTASPSTDVLGTVTLFVSTTAPFLPVGATLVVSQPGGKVVEREATLYGRWGERIRPLAPSGATPWSSLVTG